MTISSRREDLQEKAAKVVEMRKASGLRTQEEAGKAVGVSRRTWQGYERGEREIPQAIIELFCFKLELDHKIWFPEIEPYWPKTANEKRRQLEEEKKKLKAQLDAINKDLKSL